MFHFSCVPSDCDLRCCTTGHPLVLSPFEIQRISSATGLSYDTLEDHYFEASYDPKTGFPLVTINREKRCPFLEGTHCSVYHARPLVCRLFPIGKLYDNDFRYVLLSMNACAGFQQNRAVSVSRYREEQDTSYYDRLWEIWVDFVNRVEAIGLVDDDFFRAILTMLIYNTDLPPAGMTPDSLRGLDEEEVFRHRLNAAAAALPRLNTIMSSRKPTTEADSPPSKQEAPSDISSL